MAVLLARLAMRHPAVVLAAVALITIVSLLGTPRLRSVSFLEGNLPAGDPELSNYRLLVNEFGSDQVVVFAISCGEGSCDDIFEPQPLRLIRSLSDRALAAPGVERVDSVTTAGVLVGDESTLAVKRLDEASDPSGTASFRSAASEDPLFLGRLISEDLRTAAIIATFRNDLSDAARNRAAVAMADALRVLAEAEGYSLFASGTVLRAAIADRYVQRDLLILTPVLVAVVALLLFWIFRDLASVAIALTAVGVPTIWAFGLMGWTDTPITPVVSTMPIVILVIGTTDAVHFLVRVHELSAASRSPSRLVLEVAMEVGPPTTATAITSALGFLSFLAGPIPSLREFGVFSAVGIGGCWGMTFALIPIVVSRRKAAYRTVARPAFAMGDDLLVAAQRMSHRRSRFVMWVTGAFVAAAIVGIARIVPENDTTKLLGEGDPLIVSEQFLRDNLGPADSLEVLYAPRTMDLLARSELEQLRRAEAILGQHLDAKQILSPLTILRLANREMGSGTLSVPLELNASSQLFLLAEAADPEATMRVLTPDHRLGRISAGYAWSGSRAVERDIAQVRQELTSTLGKSGEFWLTGSVVLATHLGDVVLHNQVASFLAAFSTIFAVLFFFVRSVSLATLGMIPNLIPVAIILGFMGLVGINLDVGTAMIASIVLGVSTDDTIHFLVHYQHAKKKGATVRDSVAYTFAVAGKPAIFSATALALGFFLLGFSSFQSLAIFGLLSGVTVLLALACELLILPAILEITAGRRDESLR